MAIKLNKKDRAILEDLAQPKVELQIGDNQLVVFPDDDYYSITMKTADRLIESGAVEFTQTRGRGRDKIAIYTLADRA